MEVLVVFGLPGTGKTYIGKILEKYFGFYLYDGDQDMSQELKDAIVKETVTDNLRQEFFNQLIENVGKLKRSKIVVTQTFIKEKYRVQFLKAFPDAKFILLQTLTEIREKRLMLRDKFELPLEKWRRMVSIFGTPKLPHTLIVNDSEGEENLKKQLQRLLT